MGCPMAVTVWRDVLPREVALAQAAYERRQQVRRVCRIISQKHAARYLGVSHGRISQMVLNWYDDVAPIQRWFDADTDLHKLVRLIKRRQRCIR
jgi:hypothetical protein